MRAAVLLVVALSLVGCKRTRLEDLRFDKVESLPGFEVGLPAGKRLKAESTPAAGQVLYKAGAAVFVIGWQAGKATESDLPMFAKASIDALGAAMGDGASEQRPVPLPAPNYGIEMSLPTDKGVVLVLTLVQCVHSNVTVTLATMAARERPAAIAFHARMLATFRCREDGPPLVVASGLPDFDAGDAIAYLPSSDPPSYHDLAGARWVVTPATSSMRKAYQDPKVVAEMFNGLGMPIVDQERVAHGADWLVVRLTGLIDGERGKLLMGVLECKGDAAFFVLYMNPSAMDQAPDLGVLDRVRCPTTPVDPASVPTVPARFGALCDGGNGQACAVLAALATEEPTLLPGLDAAALLAKACKLGVAAACAAP